MGYKIPKLPLRMDLETKAVLKQLNLANKELAQLKGISKTIPNETILINSLSLQEAKDSSAIENIVTTHDELYKAELDLKKHAISASTKEVQNYNLALREGFKLVRKNKILNNNIIKKIQEILEGNKAGFRKVPGTALKNDLGEIIYEPPQHGEDIEIYMQNLEKYINNDELSDIDPLIKMTIIHHQFESIHPFYDGNGRTGRIINILYLVAKDLLDLPILYLSRYIITNKTKYYRLLQEVRDHGAWEEWILFMLKGVEETATQTIELVKGISALMMEYKHKIRPILGKSYRHELLNNLFNHPYTKIEFVEQDLGVQRKTAAKYLNMLVEEGFLIKEKISKSNYYLNVPLINLFLSVHDVSIKETEQIDSVHETKSE